MDEARLAGLVRHPNAVGVLDVGEDDEGPFLIMDFVEGVSLSRLISEGVQAQRPVPMQVAMRICMDAAQGLHAAHEVRAEDGTILRLVHRDVSPQNILIGFDGTVRVTDFGIAKALGNASRTSAGVLKGNMGYLAPEQLRFEDPDRRSDFFSLGVTLYELLAGRRLYPNKSGFDGTRRILSEPPPDIGEVRSDVPPELCELLFEMLAKDRESRPSTAVDIASRLEMILAALIAEEGSVTVSDYMSQHFAAACQEQRAVLAAHLKRIEADRPSLMSIPAVAVGGARALAESAAVGRARRNGRVWLAGVAVVAAAGVAIAFGIRPSIPAPPIALPAPTAPATPVAADPAGSAAAQAPLLVQAQPVAPPRADRLEVSARVSAAARPLRASASERSPRGAASDHHRPGRHAAHRARTAESARAQTSGARNGADQTHLAVPLFDRWQ